MSTVPLKNQPKAQMLRVLTKSNSPKIVDREGGDFGAGLIRGLSVITRGEALGHGMWIDDVFLSQVEAALQAEQKTGLKSRFTHPDLSADGLAKFLGRVKGGHVDGDQVFTDLHLAKSAHRSPDGDLAGYVLDRTEEDPGGFGASIVFYRDLEAETEFALSNGATADDRGRVGWDGFKSPDEANANNYPHARLAALEATDLVDEPAANPSGMFHRGPIAEIGKLADFALGRSTEAPAETTALNVNPERFRDYVNRYLETRGLQIVEITPAENDPPEEPPPPDATSHHQSPDPPPNPATSAAPLADCSRANNRERSGCDKADRPLSEYCDTFGLQDGARFYLANTPFAEAQAETLANLKAENARLKAQAALAAKESPEPLHLANKDRKSLRDLTRIRS